MKWRKLDKLFDPADFTLGDGFGEFAKSPQALVLDDRIRIFFCTQKRTPNGKYISLPHFVDFDHELKRVIEISQGPVINLGALGTFDEHGIFPLNILKYRGQVWGFTTGWSRRTSVSIDMEIGLVVSADNGRSFDRIGTGGPVMSARYNEPCLVGDAFVRATDDGLNMWYIFGSHWDRDNISGLPERHYRIAYAHSTDGINWQRDGRYIIEPMSEHECQALPSVAVINGIHHMIFCYRDAFDFRDNPTNSYRLGYAYSEDGVHWTRDDNSLGISPSTSDWDSEMMCYPHIFECNQQYYLLYNGNEFGRNGFGVAILEQE